MNSSFARSPQGTSSQKRARRALYLSISRVPGLADIWLRRTTARARTELETACDALAALPPEIEERFLACGRALQEQVKLTAQLREHGGHLVTLDYTREAGDTLIKKVSSLVHDNLDMGDAFASEVQRLGNTLEDHAKSLESLLADQAQIERSFAPMHVLQSFLRIESATLSEEVRALFLTVTEEMRRLHANVMESFAAQTQRLSQTRRDVLETARQLCADAARHFETTARKRESVRLSLANLENELVRIRQRNACLQAVATDLDQEIDGISVGVQYQDITRQKIEHVRTSAREVLERFGNRDTAPFAKRVRAQRILCQLQSAHLADVQQELELATMAISGGLQALLGRLQAIERDCLSAGDLDQVVASMDSLRAETINAHDVSASVLRDALTNLRQSIDSAERFAAATTGATDTMRRIALDLHFMGLNAQVQAVQAGNGSLEVLAGAAAAISSEAGSLTLNFEQKLLASTEALSVLVAQSRAVVEEEHRLQEVRSTHDAALLSEFTEQNETGKITVSTVGSLLARLLKQADTFLHSLDLADFPREPISRARDIFDRLATACGEFSPGDMSGDEEVLSSVQTRYTMNSERAAHAAVVRGSGATEAATTTTGDGNVEFFDDSSAIHDATPSPSPSPPAQSHQLGDNIEFF